MYESEDKLSEICGELDRPHTSAADSSVFKQAFSKNTYKNVVLG